MLNRQAADEQIIRKVREGNTDAFGILYEEYARRIFMFLYAQLDSRLDAEAITEEVFFRAWKGLPGFNESRQSFLAFLFQVAGILLAEHWQRSGTAPATDGHAAVRPGWVELGQDAAVPVGAAFDFRGSMDGLAEEYRNVIIYRFLTGLSPEETALVMQRSVGAVLVLQHRALCALQQKRGDARV